MEGSTVYFTDFRCPVGTSLTDKLRRLGSVLSQEHTAEGVMLRWRAEKANVDYALREGAVLLETERK